LLNADLAKQSGGRLLLRIEDIDAVRCRPEFEAAIYEDLAWLGIAWEQPVRRQSDQLDIYRSAIERLAADDLVYPAFESRAEIARMVQDKERETTWPRDPDGAPLYPGHARDVPRASRNELIESGAPFAWRLDNAAARARVGRLSWREQGSGPAGEGGIIAAAPEAWGDVILGRKDTPTSYHLSVVIDDALQGITDVVRGQDLFWATSLHRLLQVLLELPHPAYRHHDLIRGDQGQKLSKSNQATGLRELRRNGATPMDLRRIVGLAG
jgi:glutamyl-Q tRNA(Asp) synthetase